MRSGGPRPLSGGNGFWRNTLARNNPCTRRSRTPYCYPGSSVLRNRLDISDAEALEAFETEITAARAEEPLPVGRLSVAHYRAIHRHLFQDVYAWAGRFRTIRIAKDGNPFCFPEYIGPQMTALFADLRRNFYLCRRTPSAFVTGTTDFLTELNHIHPFREGNGRTQLAFLTALSEYAGHSLDFSNFEPAEMLTAMIASYHDDKTSLERLLARMAGL
jgi:cell filamentation protein